MSNYRRKNSKLGFNSCNKTGNKSEQSCNRTMLSAKMKGFYLRALSKSQIWPADHGRINHFDHEIGFF